MIFKDYSCLGRALPSRNRRFRDKTPFRVWSANGGGGGEAKKDAPDARQNVGPQPHVSLAAPFVPFGVPRRDRRGAFGALVEEGPGRREAFAAVGLHKRLPGRAVPGKCVEGRERRSGPPGRSGFLPVHRSDVENPRCRSRSPVRCTARLEARRSRRSTKVWACLTGPAVPGAALSRSCARDGAEILERLGGMTPSCLKRLLTRAGKRWKTKKEEAMDREAETGEAVSCAVSLDGVPLRPDGDEEACWASSGTVSGADGTRLPPDLRQTLSFGPETGKTTALLAAEVARKVRPDAGRPESAPTLVAVAAPDNWTFLERLRPDEQAVDFFHACEHPGEVADRRDRLVRPRRATLPTASTRLFGHYLRDKATTKTAVLEREVLPQAQTPPTRASRSEVTRSGVVREQGAGQPAHETGALERRRRPERPHLQGVVGPLRRCVAGDDRAAQTTA